MIMAWVFLTAGVIAVLIDVKIVAPLLLLAAIAFFINGRFRWLSRAWHASDEWPRWTRFFGIPLLRFDVVLICISVAAVVLILLYADLSS